MKFYLIIIIFLLAIFGYMYDNGFLKFNYPSNEKYSIRGIDISHHQGNIDWDLINKEKIKFVYIKATEGANYKDEKFYYNWREAKRHGIATGAYHFFTFCKTGQEQAENFIKTVPNESNSLPPVIDLEFIGNCKNFKTKKQIIDDIVIVEKMLSSFYNKKTIFYTTKEFHEYYLSNIFLTNPLWYRDVFNEPKVDNKKIIFWQYWHHGRVDGIKTPVDLNVFNGREKNFKKLVDSP